MDIGRTIRVFVSSTFLDMKVERDYLVKFTFPKLRKICEARNVVWGEVDLRWGITEEESAEGKALPICLEEIRRCRPYFIGLLGERYGSIPDFISQDLIEREPWLHEHLSEAKSVTELEILHGVLNKPELSQHAFFYFRNPAYLTMLSPKSATEFSDTNSPRGKQLELLKDRIREASVAQFCRLHEGFNEPEELGAWVYEDFARLLDQLYPINEVPDLLDREAYTHEAFARNRSRIYIVRPEYFEELDVHAAGEGPPKVVLGEQGAGKSALLANWFLRYRESNPDDFAFIHFIGGTPDSTDYIRLLRRVMMEMKRAFPTEFPGEVSLEAAQIHAEFSQWLERMPPHIRIIIVIDGLDRLEDRNGALELGWLPVVFPSRCRLILSTLPGRSLDIIRQRARSEMVVEPLSEAERRQLTNAFLQQGGRRLSPERLERIASSKQTSNPLFLRVMLDELRQFGENELLGQRLEFYLTSPNTEELYQKILGRWEEDYDRDRPGLVRDAMSLLGTAKNGLAEIELLELMRRVSEERLPQAKWSPFLLAAEDSLVIRSGLIGFSHDFLRQAIRKKYLSSHRLRNEMRSRLITYFNQQDLSLRKIEELPAQLFAAEDWKAMATLFADPEFLLIAWVRHAYRVRAFWSAIETNSEYRMVKSYQHIINGADSFDPAVTEVIANLLDSSGHRVEGLILARHNLMKARRTNRKEMLAPALLKIASVLTSMGQFDEAEGYLIEARRIFSEKNLRAGEAAALGNLGFIEDRRGQREEALQRHVQAGKIYEELNDVNGWLVALNNQAGVLLVQGDWQEALRLYQQIETIANENGNKEAAQRAVANQGVVYRQLSRNEEALSSFAKAEAICREFGLTHGLQRALGNQARIHLQSGRLDKASELVGFQQQLCERLADPFELQICLGIKAAVLKRQERLDEALNVLHAREKVLRKLKLAEEIVDCLINQAAIHLSLDQIDEYDRCMREAESYVLEEEKE